MTSVASAPKQVQLNPSDALANINLGLRQEHAQEILGKKQYRELASNPANSSKFKKALFEIVKKGLPKAHKNLAYISTNLIIEEANRHGMDPFFLFAFIENESSFNPDAIGTSGEVGLMQILPTTAEWVAVKFKLSYYGPESLKNPVVSIPLGVAYLSYLKEKFAHKSKLYLPAYNMGPTNVNRALSKNVLPIEYSDRILKRYVRIYKDLNVGKAAVKSPVKTKSQIVALN